MGAHHTIKTSKRYNDGSDILYAMRTTREGIVNVEYMLIIIFNFLQCIMHQWSNG